MSSTYAVQDAHQFHLAGYSLHIAYRSLVDHTPSYPEMADAEEMIDGVQSNLLRNRTIETIVWEDAGVTVKDRRTGKDKDILSSVHGMVKAGEMLAIMGPSCVCLLVSAESLRAGADLGRQWLGQINAVEHSRTKKSTR